MIQDFPHTIFNAKSIGIELSKESAEKVAVLIGAMMDNVSKLDAAIGKHDFGSIEDHIQYCAQIIRPSMDELQKYADALEGKVADDF